MGRSFKGDFLIQMPPILVLTNLPSAPLSARLRTLADHTYNTLGLYVSSLFSV